jgi:hypothetical protein
MYLRLSKTGSLHFLCYGLRSVDAITFPSPSGWALALTDLFPAMVPPGIPHLFTLTRYVLLYNAPRVTTHRLVCLYDSCSTIRFSQHDFSTSYGLLCIVLSDRLLYKLHSTGTYRMPPLLGLRSSPQGELWASGCFSSPPPTSLHFTKTNSKQKPNIRHNNNMSLGTPRLTNK